MIETNKVYQILFDYSLGIRLSSIPKFRSICFRIYNIIRKFHRKNFIQNKFITYKSNGQSLIINTGHQLPFTISYNKLYSSNLPRFCKYISEKYSNFSLVDIGANIGDSAFLIKQLIDCKILCVEGNKEYTELLFENTKKYLNVELELSFVGDPNNNVPVKVVSDGNGTSFLIKQANTEDSNKHIDTIFKSLEEIISLHPNFQEYKLLKLDTDGFDCEIIRSNIDFIKKSKPVIFFEYAPAWIQTGKDSELSTFDILNKVGYSKLIFYTGGGELLFSCDAGDKHIIKYAHEYFARSTRFGDIVAISENDIDIYDKIMKKEIEFMRSFFG